PRRRRGTCPIGRADGTPPPAPARRAEGRMPPCEESCRRHRGQKSRGDLFPLLVERIFAALAARLSVPVGGVVEIALDAMQIAVNPGAVLRFVGLGGLVSHFPIALPVPPQSKERGRK